MMHIRILFSILLFFIYNSTIAQTGLQPVNGTVDDRQTITAFINANIIDAKSELINATLIIEKEKIIAVGLNIDLPVGCKVVDLKGKYIYPSFIDLYSDYGAPKSIKMDRGGQEQALTRKKGAYYWNQAIHPETNNSEQFTKDAEGSKAYLQAGFGVVLSHQINGIARGTGCLVSLAKLPDHELILNANAATFFSFNKGNSTQDYPSSLMGSIALLRQSFYDAQWYKNQKITPAINWSLSALVDQEKMPTIFEANDKLNCLRAYKIGDEFKKDFILKTDGTEYQRIEELSVYQQPLIVPINFPKPYEVGNPYYALEIPFEMLKHWEMAPANLALLDKHAMPFTITYYGIKSADEFWKNMRKAISYGLSTESALKALTLTPAKIIGADKLIGTIEIGKLANFFICSHPLFNEKNKIYQNYTLGQLNLINELNMPIVSGAYQVSSSGLPPFKLINKGSGSKVDMVALFADSTQLKTTNTITPTTIVIQFNYPKDSSKQLVSLMGVWAIGSQFSGTGQLANGNWFTFNANEITPKKIDSIKNTPPKPIAYGQVRFPFLAYGNDTIPVKKSVLIKNATVWTNELDSVLYHTDLYLENGIIKTIGVDLKTNAALVIDATNKYVTTGIIDEHSHIAATGGVNEGTQSVTSEVRIADIITCDDINILRQLAGGVTSSHILHGSANAIGGQTQLIKLRWGMAPEQMKIVNAPGFIKFALGENVKQANWGDNATTRFPQTRMGVEQVYQDAFNRASAYQKNKLTEIGYRTDLELEALSEILQHKRFITCHSYVQSEINMLMHVADTFGFKVNTFTHILEGYKVADKMKKHGVLGASTFSDWWAYKYEVMEAIPQNASIMNKVGLTVAINSDDAEMARRLNQEVAKSIKYGNMSRMDAFKMCSLNPAIMLQIADKVGSIKTGKDADIVIWNNVPTSVYALADYTFVDGILYYDRLAMADKKIAIQKERAQIIQKMIQAKKEGEATQIAIPPAADEYSCGADGH
jgi:imidazolonepropionase-like amidohydrolase